MAEKTRYHCPNCSYLIRGDLRKVSAVTCRNCHQQYSVLYDEDDGKIALVEIVTARTVEPLNLPKGSIRAVTTMATSVAAWFFVFAGKDIPEFLASLMLAILGYYFGFRTKVKGAETRIHDATIEKLEPLYLPEGFIRGFLVFGFAAAAITLYVTGRLTHTGHLGFFIVLAGLIVGYVFAKAVAGIRGTPAYNFLQHIKGVLVIGSTVAMIALLMSGSWETHPMATYTLSTVISFYFGSRS